MRPSAAEGESVGGSMQHHGPREGVARLLAASGGRPPNVLRMRPSAAEGDSVGGAMQHNGPALRRKVLPAAGGLWWLAAECARAERSRRRIGWRYDATQRSGSPV